MNDVQRWYDRLIEEDNDPFRDPPALCDYMNRWDGDAFFELLALRPNEDVLEIGVGTGRLAARAAVHCACIWGIDLSPKTIFRAQENLAAFSNVRLLCGDFLTCNWNRDFDAAYSSLTFLHFPDKEAALRRTFELLRPNGRFVLSIDKNQASVLNMDGRRLTVYPDSPEEILRAADAVGFVVTARRETDFAYLFHWMKAQ